MSVELVNCYEALQLISSVSSITHVAYFSAIAFRMSSRPRLPNDEGFSHFLFAGWLSTVSWLNSLTHQPATSRHFTQLNCRLHHPTTNSLSESELLYDSLFTANQFVLAPSSLRLTASIFKRNPYCHSPYVTSSLTRGWLCRLQILLVFASARGTRDHILLSQIRDSPNLEGQIPRNWVPFSSPPTSRRAPHGLRNS
jgi:hypothetical protein